MYTLGELKEKLKWECWPEGIPDQLWTLPSGNPGPVQKLFIEALMQIQKWVPAYQQNNTQIVPFCATFFQCGMSVFEAPRGKILSLRSIVKLDASCQQTSSAANNYCAEVYYSRVDYNQLTSLLDKKLRCACSTPFAALAGMPSLTCQKTLRSAYPAPDDADYCNFPELPLGFHYPQSSTDMNRRARQGVWALYRNRIYVAPWINSTETIILDWDGLKRQWDDADAVDTEEDPLFDSVVKHYVLWQYNSMYKKDQVQANVHMVMLKGNGREIIGALPELISQVREETRQLADKEIASSNARMSGKTLVGQSTGTICLGDDCLPSAPTGLELNEEPSNHINITWEPGSGSLPQEIWKSQDGGDYVLFATVAKDLAVYDDDVTASADPYKYKVRGQNRCGYSAFSDPVEIIIT